ncbi:MAG: single-stranded DNA-binding protein [Mycobacteriales bacterium]
MDTLVTVCGNVVADPIRRVTPSGLAVAGLRLASTPRRFDRVSGQWKDAPTLFINVTCWRSLADNVAQSLHKGDPVIVYGRLVFREWKDKEEQARHGYEIEALVMGPDLSRATCGQIQRPSWAAGSPSWVASLEANPEEAGGSASFVPDDQAEPVEEEAPDPGASVYAETTN